MKQYKGYYIDNVIFHNEKEVDNFIREKAILHYTMLNQIFKKEMSFESSVMCSDYEIYMHDTLGFSFEELEAIEAAA